MPLTLKRESLFDSIKNIAIFSTANNVDYLLNLYIYNQVIHMENTRKSTEL